MELEREKSKSLDENGDYIFRFEIFHHLNNQKLYEEPVIEFLRRLLASVLEVVVLTHGNKDVSVDGFKLGKDEDTIYKIWKDNKILRQEDRSS